MLDKFGMNLSGFVGMCFGFILCLLFKMGLRSLRNASIGKKDSVYGLQHGRLHLQIPTPMWMNMGYWDATNPNQTMAEAGRDLLKAVLKEAGLSGNPENTQNVQHSGFNGRCLVDLGFGCGDQTVYLMSPVPIRPTDTAWWDKKEAIPLFDRYIGITNDTTQARYASMRIDELKLNAKFLEQRQSKKETSSILLYCGDAAKPASWGEDLRQDIYSAVDGVSERWVLALDTAYHFSPSRWPLITHARNRLKASFMAFDLCLSPDATFSQRVMLRLLTSLMGAPWMNFVTISGYRQKLIECGYSDDSITITDISEQVFMPLSNYMEQQDTRLKSLGLGLGGLSLAKTMFAWWGRTGIVRGVIIAARR